MVNVGMTRRLGRAAVGNGDVSALVRSGKLNRAPTLATDFSGVVNSSGSSGKSSIRMTMTVMSSVRVSY